MMTESPMPLPDLKITTESVSMACDVATLHIRVDDCQPNSQNLPPEQTDGSPSVHHALFPYTYSSCQDYSLRNTEMNSFALSEMIYLSALPKDEIDLHSDPSCSQSSPPIISTLLTSTPSRLNNENRCSVCTLPILERYILYVDGRAFHCHCLRCSACDVDLGLESSCYTKDGMLLCKRDYYRLAKLSQVIIEVTRDRTAYLRTVPQTKLAMTTLQADSMLNRTSFHAILEYQKLLILYKLQQCDWKIQELKEQQRLRAAKQENVQPIQQKIPQPQTPMTIPNHFTPEFFVFKPYGKYRTSCTKCGSPVLETDFVMRARDFVYHINCFSCAYCGLPLQTGECCGVDASGAVFCQPHYDAMLLSNAQQMDSKANSKEDNNVPDADNIDYDAEDSNSGGKSKRMRTSFKHHQLRTMKTYFNLNHNPDAKDLKQLAAKTGLTKRVLQVWFQNARAKYRRSMHQRNNSVSPGFGPSLEGNQVGSTSVSSSHSPPTPFGTSQTSVECKAVQDFFDDVNKTINAINNASTLL